MNFLKIFRRTTDEPETDLTRRFRLAAEVEAVMAEQNYVVRPPNAETLIGSSDWIWRTGRRRRNVEADEALKAGSKSWFRALEK